ncbi:uncharacterized protein PF3D7_1120600-like [Calliphora vicina]|uniref:uncharacterized protein PF3D7_1120600-like n=1 Tax=Calliphora vicina TaxID=7373 RepID=UPI00325AB6CE
MKMQIHYKHNMSLNNTGISRTTEKCFTNIELVTNICKFLNYGQQFQLSKVSRELNHIIVNFVWKLKFKEVEILIFHKTTDNLVSDRIDIQANNLLSVTKQCDIISKQSTFLKTNELEIFLNLNVYNINKLQLITANDHCERVIVKFPLKQNFKNLNYLSYVRITLASEDLQKLADNCLKLETLVMCNCLNREGQTLVLDNDIDIQIIKNMRNLKNLIIKDSNEGSDNRQHLYTISNIEHILNQTKLQCLNINVHILPDSNTLKKELTVNNLKCCTNFQIGRFVECSNFIDFQTNILENFENLKNLYLSGYKFRTNITTDLFNILLKSCENLTNLTLDQCRIMDFIALPKLQHLSLRSCQGLTFINLKTMLNEMHLI